MTQMTNTMPDPKIRKDFGLRVKNLRKQHKWTQKELGKMINTPFSMLNKYESGLNAPPMEKLIQLAEVFGTTVDYLLTGDSSDEKPLHSNRLLERFRELEHFNTQDKEVVINLIDAMIVRQKVENAVISR
jgi:transcriptional regulator with XRE-family HTH domain